MPVRRCWRWPMARWKNCSTSAAADDLPVRAQRTLVLLLRAPAALCRWPGGKAGDQAREVIGYVGSTGNASAEARTCISRCVLGRRSSGGRENRSIRIHC
jgi:hypothetical protein